MAVGECMGMVRDGLLLEELLKFGEAGFGAALHLAVARGRMRSTRLPNACPINRKRCRAPVDWPAGGDPAGCRPGCSEISSPVAMVWKVSGPTSRAKAARAAESWRLISSGWLRVRVERTRCRNGRRGGWRSPPDCRCCVRARCPRRRGHRRWPRRRSGEIRRWLRVRDDRMSWAVFQRWRKGPDS